MQHRMAFCIPGVIDKSRNWLAGAACAIVCALTPFTATADVAVVTTIKPLHSLVSAIMQGRGEPHLLIRGSGTPHEYALRPSDAAALQEAAIVFWIGPELETFLADGLAKSARRARIIALGTSERITQRVYREGEAWNTGGHNHQASHGHGHGHGHDHGGGNNPHIWLDPENAKVIAEMAGEALAKADPVNAPQYRTNVIRTVRELNALRTEVGKRVFGLQGRNYVVFHDAFQHFEERFGLPALGAVRLGDARMPGARRLAALRKTIVDRKVVCVFSEPQFEPRLVRTLIAGTGARSGMLDPLGADLEPGPGLYSKLLRRNAAAFEACLRPAG